MHVHASRAVLLAVAAAGALLAMADAARMDAARSFIADAGFNVTVGSLGSQLRLFQTARSPEFTFKFHGGKQVLIDEDAEFDDEAGAAGGDDDDAGPPLMGDPTAIEVVPSWEQELWTGDQVVGFEGVPLSSLSFQDVVASQNPAKNFRPGQKYAVPVYGAGDAVQGFLLTQFVELSDEHHVQIMPSAEGGRAAELVRLREEERKRRIQQQILAKQQKLKQIKTENTSYTYFEISMTKKNKMNLLFAPSKLPLTLSARVKYLREGDELMSVNGIDVLKLDLQAAFDVLRDSAFPKKLKWRRLIDLSEDLTIQLGSLQLSGPAKALSGCLPYRIAKFGEAPVCEQAPLIDLGYACDPVDAAELWPPAGDVHNAMALLWRDTTCSFLDKTLRAQQLGSSVALHVNTQNELLQVEAKNAESVTVPVVQISKKHGQLLQHIVARASEASRLGDPFGSGIGVRIGDPLICGYGTAAADGDRGACPTLDPLDVEVAVSAKLARKRAKQLRSVNKFLPARLLKRDKNEPMQTVRKRKRVKTDADGYATPYGAFHFWNGGEGFTATYAIATFGLEPELTPQLVMWASDKQNRISDLCHSQGMLKMGQIRKAECVWLLGKRGGCAYTKKAKVAEGIGACGMVIVNNEETVSRMPFKTDEESEIKQIKMTSIMISSKAGELIEAQLDAMGTEPAVFRLEPGVKVDDGAVPESAAERRRRQRRQRTKKAATKVEL